jgi:hydroxymethylglutaryl-CoA lyase
MPEKAEFAEIVEVGPRDGLQNEKTVLSVDQKVELIDKLSQVGFRRIEAGSFVSPKWVPQMADSDVVLARIARRTGVKFAALTPNIRGYENAIAAKADEVAIFASASEGFSQANINATIAESLERFRPIAEKARHADIPLRGYISCVVECPFDGAVSPKSVAALADSLFAMGCFEISLGDTIGTGTPDKVTEMLKAVIERVPAHRLAGHYHDTHGYAVQNVLASLQAGLRVFDASVGGLGGCPYAPGASGNISTNTLNELLVASGFQTGLDVVKLAVASEFALGLVNPSGGRQ